VTTVLSSVSQLETEIREALLLEKLTLKYAKLLSVANKASKLESGLWELGLDLDRS